MILRLERWRKNTATRIGSWLRRCSVVSQKFAENVQRMATFEKDWQRGDLPRRSSKGKHRNAPHSPFLAKGKFSPCDSTPLGNEGIGEIFLTRRWPRLTRG